MKKPTFEDYCRFVVNDPSEVYETFEEAYNDLLLRESFNDAIQSCNELGDFRKFERLRVL